MIRKLMTSTGTALLLVVWTLGAVAAAAPALAADASANMEGTFLANIDALLSGMGAKQIVDRKDDQMAFERICMENSGPDKSAERAALCKAIMQRVGPDVAMPARVWLLRKVEPIGREEVVEGLTALLADNNAEIRELARRALANNPAPQAAESLRAELDKATDTAWKISLINALGWRGDREAVDRLAKLAGDKNLEIAKAAIEALGTIADDASLEVLARLRQDYPRELEATIRYASLRAAQRLVEEGSRRKAGAICEEIFAAATCEPMRMSSLQGLVAARRGRALPTLIELIKGSDSRMQLVAARYAQEIDGRRVSSRLAEAMKDMSSDAQAVVLDVLGKRGDASVRPAVIQCGNAGAPEVQVAAVEALRHLGDGSTVEMLAELAGKSQGELRDAARNSLKWMRGDDVDASILDLIGKTSDRTKAELVRAAAVRLMKPALAVLLANTHDADESVRVPVVYNIGKLAAYDRLPEVILSFQNLQGDRTREIARDALVDICSRNDDREARTRPLIDAMNKVDSSTQVIILRALANLKGQAALDAMRRCASSQDPQVRQAATGALAEWGPIYCSTWVFSGPYAKEGAAHTELFDVPFPPENDQADVVWKPVKQGGRDIDLQKLADGSNICGYVRTQVVSAKAQDAVLTLGSDDGIKVWLNGKVVHANNATRGHQPDEEAANIRLEQGRNTLLLKVTQGGGQWSFSCGLKSPKGGPADGVSFDAK